mmetsp:Transcript_7569/g.30740  ORF Transcript_7569/g.30740 Transcript_7569/m.30740 type:complete len:244 (-) Transcript_7569:1643-2374(-)
MLAIVASTGGTAAWGLLCHGRCDRTHVGIDAGAAFGAAEGGRELVPGLVDGFGEGEWDARAAHAKPRHGSVRATAERHLGGPFHARTHARAVGRNRGTAPVCWERTGLRRRTLLFGAREALAKRNQRGAHSHGHASEALLQVLDASLEVHLARRTDHELACGLLHDVHEGVGLVEEPQARLELRQVRGAAWLHRHAHDGRGGEGHRCQRARERRRRERGAFEDTRRQPSDGHEVARGHALHGL